MEWKDMIWGKGKNIIEKIIAIGCPVTILIICLMNVYRLYGAVIVPDEIGYWASGALFNGENWSDSLTTSSYYGWGYGLILGLILKLNVSPVISYRIAIAINALMLVACYFVAQKICKILFKNFSVNSRRLICLAATLYSGYIFYSQTTYCETLLLLLFWLSALLILQLTEKVTVKKCILLSVVASFMVAVHLRMLVVSIAIFMTMFYLILCRKLKIRHLSIIVITICLGIAGVLLVKDYVVQSLYMNSIMPDNTLGGQISKMSLLLSWDGIKRLVMGFVGRLMYLGSASFLMIYVFLGQYIYKIYKFLVKKESLCNIKHSIFLFYISITLIGEMLLSSYSMMTFSRIDHIIYGRYNEFVLGAVILYVLCTVRKSNILKYGIVSIACHMMICLLTYVYMLNKNLGALSAYAVPGIWGFYSGTDMDLKVKSTIYAGVISIAIFVLLILLVRFGFFKIMTILSCVLWSSIALYGASISLYREQEGYEKDYNKFAEETIDILNGESVYYVINNTEFVSWSKLKLKFFMPYTDVIGCETYEYSDVEFGQKLILYNDRQYSAGITCTLSEPILSTQYFTLYEKQDNKEKFLKENKKNSDSKFIDNLYKHLLGRDADKIGKKQFGKMLKSGYTRAQIYDDIYDSDEFQDQINRK